MTDAFLTMTATTETIDNEWATWERTLVYLSLDMGTEKDWWPGNTSAQFSWAKTTGPRNWRPLQPNEPDHYGNVTVNTYVNRNTTGNIMTYDILDVPPTWDTGAEEWSGGEGRELVVVVNFQQAYMDTFGMQAALALPAGFPTGFFRVEPTHLLLGGHYAEGSQFLASATQDGLHERSIINLPGMKARGNGMNLYNQGIPAAYRYTGALGGRYDDRLVGYNHIAPYERGMIYRPKEAEWYSADSNLHFGLPATATFTGFGWGPDSYAFWINCYVRFYMFGQEIGDEYVGRIDVDPGYPGAFNFSEEFSMPAIPAAADSAVLRVTLEGIDPEDPGGYGIYDYYVTLPFVPTVAMGTTRPRNMPGGVCIPGRLWRMPNPNP
jgi:hypothetical protein